MNQDGQNSTKIKCQGQEFAHRKGKTSALKPVLWNMVLCFYFNVVWVIFPHLWLPQKASASSLFRLKSNCCLTLHHSSVQGAHQERLSQERLLKSYALLASLQTVFSLVYGNEVSFSSEIQN